MDMQDHSHPLGKIVPWRWREKGVATTLSVRVRYCAERLQSQCVARAELRILGHMEFWALKRILPPRDYIGNVGAAFRDLKLNFKLLGPVAGNYWPGFGVSLAKLGLWPTLPTGKFERFLKFLPAKPGWSRPRGPGRQRNLV